MRPCHEIMVRAFLLVVVFFFRPETFCQARDMIFFVKRFPVRKNESIFAGEIYNLTHKTHDEKIFVILVDGFASCVGTG